MNYLAEKNIIGSLLMDPDAAGGIASILEPEMMEHEILRCCYLEFLKAHDNGLGVEMVSLSQKVEASGYQRNDVLKIIKECISDTLTSAQVKSYAQAVANDYKARKLAKIMWGIKPAPGKIDIQIGELLSKLEALRAARKIEAKTLGQIAAENKAKYFCEDTGKKLNLGFSKIDDCLGGLEGGDVIVIGARPGVGKSAFVTQVITNLSKAGKRVGFYNLEMQEKQVYERFIASGSGIGLTRLRRAKSFLGDEKARFERANAALDGQDIMISTGSKSVSEIRNESRHMGYDILVIDYLQLLKPDTRYQSRASEVGDISKRTKSLAMELNIPVIELSQLNRTSELRETKEPTMAELREAGDIEQDASIIILMWNLSNSDKSMKGCKIEKNRQGGTRKVALKFDGDLMQFAETDKTIKQATEWTRVDDEENPFPCD